MARSVAVIQAQLIAAIQADKNLYDPTNPDPLKQGLTSKSMVAYWLLWTFIQAVCIALFEQICDVFISDVEAIVAAAPPNSPQWVRNKILAFQYNVGIPQIAQLLPDGSIGYAIINPAYFVIDQCAVVTIQNGKYLAKVALAGQPLTSLQLIALQAYMDLWNDAGITDVIVSSLPDYVMVNANIVYNGQYASVIVANVQAVITTFLQSIPFNGVLNISDLYVAIKAVAGVTDVTFNQLEIRANAVPPSSATPLVSGGDWLLNEIGTYSGNSTPDTAGGRDLASTLNFIVA